MMNIVQIDNENVVYTGAKILVDGNSFVGCTFRNCELVFSGQAPFHMVNCEFDDTTWAMTGNADLVTNFLMALYNGFGEYGKHVAEAYFQQIRDGKTEPYTTEEWGDLQNRGDDQ